MALWSVLGVVLAFVVIMVTSATIEDRYPSYILEADTPCTKEGDFVHPKNCSWFYRCVDQLDVGFFRKYFFECANGTSFNSTISKCDITENESCKQNTDTGTGTPDYCSNNKGNRISFCFPGPSPCEGTLAQSGFCLYQPACVFVEQHKTTLQYCSISLALENNECKKMPVDRLCELLKLAPPRII